MRGEAMKAGAESREITVADKNPGKHLILRD